ncbi:glycosyltransferase [Candidatus Sumerlaeota bacterium]|nr:glycosyltransferase [Candidatus Sumerlaeota bacterium]
MTDSIPGGQENRPLATVIIPSVTGRQSLDPCLRALEQQTEYSKIEVIVANRLGAESSDRIRAQFPQVRLIECAAETSIPAMRRTGLEAARGDFIFITEDHCVPPPEWIARLLAPLQAGYDIAGGGLVNGAGRMLSDRAAFLFEYAPFARKVATHDGWTIPGNNVAYRRSALDRFDGLIREDLWEFFLHVEMRKAGLKARCLGDAPVIHDLPMGISEFIAQRFLYSRSFAAMRTRRSSLPVRLLFALASAALPAVYLWRLAKTCLPDERLTREFIVCMPFLAIYALAAAVGEGVGYLAGAGSSAGRVR